MICPTTIEIGLPYGTKTLDPRAICVIAIVSCSR